MSTVEGRRSPVYRQLEAYEQSWARSHDAVRECWACEDTIAVGLSTFALVERVDRAWRERVYRGAEDYHSEADETYRALYGLWLRITEEVLGWAEPVRETFGVVEGLEELRQATERARDILARWHAPRLARAVGLREIALPPEAARELDQILEEAKRNPSAMPTRTLDTRGPDYLPGDTGLRRDGRGQPADAGHAVAP